MKEDNHQVLACMVLIAVLMVALLSAKVSSMTTAGGADSPRPSACGRPGDCLRSGGLEREFRCAKLTSLLGAAVSFTVTAIVTASDEGSAPHLPAASASSTTFATG